MHIPLYAFPCLITLGALCCGISSIFTASQGEFKLAVQLLMSAAILDALDGHVARFLRACTELGAELDSLCDLADFGVAPALIVQFWVTARVADSMWIPATLQWAASCIYCCCCCLRLARFNLKDRAVLAALPKPAPRPGSAPVHNLFQRKLYFEGVPAPVGASYLLLPVMLDSVAPSSPFANAALWLNREAVFTLTLFVAALMVSSVPTLSSKMLKQNPTDTHLRSRSTISIVLKAVAAAVGVVVVWHFPFEVFICMNLAHMISIPLGVYLYYRCGQ